MELGELCLLEYSWGRNDVLWVLLGSSLSGKVLLDSLRLQVGMMVFELVLSDEDCMRDAAWVFLAWGVWEVFRRDRTISSEGVE